MGMAHVGLLQWRMAQPDAPIVAAARALQPMVRAHGEEAELQAGPVKSVAEAMAKAGLFRMGAPAVTGGGEHDPLSTIRAIEAISQADGATGWVLMIGIETTGIGGSYLSAKAADEVFGDHPGTIIAGALNPVGKARKVEGGYVATGQWPFASGCQVADYFWCQCLSDSDSIPIEIVVPRSEFEILETWDSPGLRGSGSHDVRVDEVFVPDHRITRVNEGHAPHPGSLYRIPAMSRLAYNKVGVATGIALGAIDHFVTLATERKPRMSSGLLRERPRAQLAIAEAEAIVGSARSYVFDVVGDLWDTIVSGGRPDERQRILIRLACSHAVATCARAVTGLYEAAGTAMSTRSAPLARCFRDIHVIGQHITVAPYIIDEAGIHELDRRYVDRYDQAIVPRQMNGWKI